MYQDGLLFMAVDTTDGRGALKRIALTDGQPSTVHKFDNLTPRRGFLDKRRYFKIDVVAGDPESRILVRQYSGFDNFNFAAIGAEIDLQIEDYASQEMISLNDKFYFDNENATQGVELWQAGAGFQNAGVLRNIDPVRPGAISNNADTQLATAGGEVFFGGATDSSPSTIWSYNVENDAVTEYDFPEALRVQGQPVAQGDAVYWVLAEQDGQSQLWRTQPGTDKAVLVFPVASMAFTVVSRVIVNHLGRLVFIAREGGDYRLYALGADGQVSQAMDFGANQILSFAFRPLTPVGDYLYFYISGVETELWRTDGTMAGTTKIVDLVGKNIFSSAFAGLGGLVYFNVENEIWATDGTAANTGPQITLDPGTIINHIETAGNGLLIRDGNSTYRRYYWVSDGTQEGTQRLVPEGLSEALYSDFTSYFARMGNDLYFNAFDPAHGTELWKTDGTLAGTALVKDINPGAGSAYPKYFFVANDTLYFNAYTDTHGEEVWATDGSEANTKLVAEVVEGPDGGMPKSFLAVSGLVLFNGQTTASGNQLWRITPDNVTGLAPDAAYTMAPLYPNPATHTLYLRPTNGRSWGHVSIVNAMGRSFAARANANGAVDVSGLAPGVYVVIARAGQERLTARFVKR